MGFCDCLRTRKVRDLMDAESATGWSWVHPSGGSGGTISQEGASFSFVFDGYEPHQLLKATGALSPTGKVLLTWSCNGSVQSVKDGAPGHVSLIVVAKGNTWSADGDQVNKRWYWSGPQIVPGGSVEIPFADAGAWNNVLGGRVGDSRGTTLAHFHGALAQAERIGLAFGNPATGNTAHGARGSGKFLFSFSVA